VKPGELFEHDGHHYWVVDEPTKVLESDFAEWETSTIPSLGVRAGSCAPEWRSNEKFVTAGSGIGRLLFIRRIDPLSFAMLKALERSKHHEQA
jgi:hypothetical protein